MEELYLPSNDGEISFVETDGGSILLEQGSQGFIQPEQGQPNTGTTIYAPHVYIIQNAPVMSRQTETQYLYGNISSPQIPLSLLQGKSGTTVLQNLQTSSASNAEYATQDVPVRHIVQVVQQQPAMQLSNSQVIQYPVQQQVLQPGHITLAQQPITYTAAIQKGPPDMNGKVHIIRQPLAIANIQSIGQRGGLRFNTPSAIRYSIQQPRAPRQFIQQHPQNSVSVTQHQSVLQETLNTTSVSQQQTVLQNVQTPCSRSEFTSSYQETFEKQQLGRTTISQGRGRGRRNSNVSQKQKLTEQQSTSGQSSFEGISKQVSQINYVPKKSNVISTTQQIGSNIISTSQQMGNSAPLLAHSQQKFSNVVSPHLQQKVSNVTTTYSQQKCSTTSLPPRPLQNSSNASSLPLQKGGTFLSPAQPKPKATNIVSTSISQSLQQCQSQDTQSISAFVRCNSDSSYSLSIPEDTADSVSTTIPITVESVESTQDKNSVSTLNKQKKVPAKKILSLEQYKARNPIILSPTKVDKDDAGEMKPPVVQHKLMVVNDTKNNKKYFIPSNRLAVAGISQQSPSILKEPIKSELGGNYLIKEESTTADSTASIYNSLNKSSIKSYPTDLEVKKNEQKLHWRHDALIVCQHCGIESEAHLLCSNCKHPLKKGTRIVSSRKVLSNDALKSNISTSIASVTNFSKSSVEQSPVTKEEFYGKNVVTKIMTTEKKLPFNTLTSNKSKSTKGRGRGKLKTYEEPEILTLSSDDDEDHSKSSSLSGSASLTDQILGLKQFSQPMSTQISSKEPNMSPDMEDLLDSVANTYILSGEDNPQGGGRIYAPIFSEYRSVRIGSYKHVPENEERVEIMKNSYIRFKVPSCLANGDGNLITADKSMVTLTIQFIHMARILFHHGNSIPVIFIYLRPIEAKNISKLLHMNETSFKFDPTGKECQKRITILLKKMDDDVKNILKSYLDVQTVNKVTGKTSKLTYEINQDDANEVLVKSSVPEAIACVRKASASQHMETKTYLVYPPPPNKGGITITEDDYGCLEEEQFLNDVILDFYLKWLLLYKLTPQNRERTHIFSTFFYKRLTSKPRKVKVANSSEDNPDLTPAQKRHARVKSWTKNVDIFEKDFILIPINEHSHWFLAVICFPGLNGPVSINDGQPVQSVVGQEIIRKAKIKAKIEMPTIDEVEWSDRDEAEGDDDELEYEEEDEENKEKESKKIKDVDKVEEAQSVPTREEVTMTADSNRAEDPTCHFKIPENLDIQPKEKVSKSKTDPSMAIKQPCILIFDSLAGAGRHRIVATLRDYLSVEYLEKKKIRKDFSKDIMKGACPKVPQQTNFSDCGIFTLQFAESFFERPIQNFKLPIKTLLDWFPQEVVAGKRESVANLIKNLMDQFKPNHGITLRAIKLNQQLSKMETSEEEEEETKENCNDATTASKEDQNTIKGISDYDGITKRKLDNEEVSSHSEMLSMNANDEQPSKSRKVNVNSKVREIIKVTQPSGSIIFHKATVNQKDSDCNAARGNNSPVTNFCDSKPVRIAFVPSRARVEMLKQPSELNSSKVELVTQTQVDRTGCNNVTDTVDNNCTRRVIRDEDTSEVLLILNDPVPSTNEDSAEIYTNTSGINVSGKDVKNMSVSQAQEMNSSLSFPHGTVSTATCSASCQPLMEKVNLSFAANNSEVAFDKLLQSSNHSQSISKSVNVNSMIIVTQPKYLQGSSSYITLNSNDPQLIYSRAPVVMHRDSLKQISTVPLTSRPTNTLQQCSTTIVPDVVTVPSSNGLLQSSHSSNLPSEANSKLAATTVIGSNVYFSKEKFINSSNMSTDAHCSVVSTILNPQATTFCNAPTYTSTNTLPSRVVSCKVSANPNSLAPSLTQPSFNITHQESQSRSELDTNNVINHTYATPAHVTDKLSTASRCNNNNFSSSYIAREVNSLISTPATVLSQPKLTTVTRSSLRSPMISSSMQEDPSQIIVTQQNSSIFTCLPSLQSTTSATGISPTLSDNCFNIQSTSPQVTSNSSNNLFSTSVSEAPTYSLSQHTDSNACSGPFSLPCSSSFDQFQSQRLSDSELLLSFASQSSIRSPSMNIPATSAISSSGDYCFDSSILSSNSTTANFTDQLSESHHYSMANSSSECSPSSAEIVSQMKNVSSIYSFSPASQVDIVGKQTSPKYQPIMSTTPPQYGHQSFASKSTSYELKSELDKSVPTSTSPTKSSISRSQLKSLSSHLSSSAKATKLQRKSKTPARTKSKPQISHINKETLPLACFSALINSPNKSFIGLSKTDHASAHQTQTNSITTQSFNSGLNHSITMFTSNNKSKVIPSFESLNKLKTSSPISKSFLPGKSSHSPTFKSSSQIRLLTSLPSALHPSSTSPEVSSCVPPLSTSLRVPISTSNIFCMPSPNISSDQLSRTNNTEQSPHSVFISSEQSSLLKTATTSYVQSQFVPSKKTTLIPMPSGYSTISQSVPPINIGNSLPPSESSIKSSISSQSLKSISSQTDIDYSTSTSVQSSFQSLTSPLKSKIPDSPPHLPFPSGMSGSPPISYTSSQDTNTLNQRVLSQSLPLNKNYSEESPQHSSISTTLLKQPYPLAPSPPPFYMPATRTSSGRNVSIPKRFLDSEQEQFFHQNKKKNKNSVARGNKPTKKGKKNALINAE